MLSPGSVLYGFCEKSVVTETSYRSRRDSGFANRCGSWREPSLAKDRSRAKTQSRKAPPRIPLSLPTSIGRSPNRLPIFLIAFPPPFIDNASVGLRLYSFDPTALQRKGLLFQGCLRRRRNRSATTTKGKPSYARKLLVEFTM